MQSRGSFLCDGGTCCDGVTAMLFLDLNLASGLILMIKQRCKQSVKSVGMACEGRARNRMLRKRWIVRSKRWIVRNPVVEGDDVTQFILARSFNTSFIICY